MQSTASYLWSPRCTTLHSVKILEQREAGALAFFSTAFHRVGDIKACLCKPEKKKMMQLHCRDFREKGFLFAQVKVRNFKILEMAGVPKKMSGMRWRTTQVTLNLSILFDPYFILSSLCRAWMCSKLMSIPASRTIQTTHHTGIILQGR